MSEDCLNNAERLADQMLDHFQLERKFEIELGDLIEPIINRLRSKGCSIIRHSQDAHLITVVCPKATPAA